MLSTNPSGHRRYDEPLDKNIGLVPADKEMGKVVRSLTDDRGSVLFRQAIHFATWVHEGQVRKYNGMPYVTHPIRCGNRALSLTGDYEIAIAMLLHDGPEDQIERCPFSLIAALYGLRVAEIVKGLTNPSKEHKEANRAERKAIDRKHYETASPVVKMCKCIDRLDNLNEMSVEQDPGFVRIYCDESALLIEVMRRTEQSPLLNSLLLELAKTINMLRNKIGVIP